MAREYTLYKIEDGKALQVDAPVNSGCRIFIFGGIYDLCSRNINSGSWKIFDRSLSYSYGEHAVYAIGPAPTQSWRENDWIRRGIVNKETAPAAQELCTQLYGKAYGGEAATKDVFLNYSTGSLLMQHLNMEAAARYSGGKFASIHFTTKALNIAPIHKLGLLPAEIDFEQASFISLADLNAAEAPKAEALWDEVNELAAQMEAEGHADGDKPQYINMAYEARLLKLHQSGAVLNNPNLAHATEAVLGYMEINGSNLVIYGASENKHPSRIIFSAKGKEKAETETHPIWAHGINAYMQIPASILGSGFTQTYQRYAAAHLITPCAKELIMGRSPFHLAAEYISDNERAFVKGLFDCQLKGEQKLFSKNFLA